MEKRHSALVALKPLRIIAPLLLGPDIIPVFGEGSPRRVCIDFQFILLGLEIARYLHTKPNEREAQLFNNTHVRISPV
jgi:hypothetical protein